MAAASLHGGEFSFGRDADLQLRFLHWEIRAGRYNAALHRLKTEDGPPKFGSSSFCSMVLWLPPATPNE